MDQKRQSARILELVDRMLCPRYASPMTPWRGYYAIVDPEACGGRAPETFARAILEGGCAVLQLRAKRLDDASFVKLASALGRLCRDHDVPFVVNDRADIAALVEADGLHLGQDDLRLEDARETFRQGCLGLSTHDAEQAREAAEAGADLIGFGPIFATSTKENADPVVGLEALQQVCLASPVPVVAIGGITIDNIERVAQAGPALAAAIGAVGNADDPSRVARALHGALLAARTGEAR